MPFPATWDMGETGRGIGPPNGTVSTMLDIAFIAAGLAFFGLAAGYAAVCERL